jgi:hypothetical protein
LELARHFNDASSPHEIHAGERDHDTSQPPTQRQDDGLRQQLPHDTAAVSAERPSNRQFTVSSYTPNQEQIRDIRANNQQHDRHGDNQQQQSRPHGRDLSINHTHDFESWRRVLLVC